MNFLSHLRDYLGVDARRRSGEEGLVDEDRFNEGRLIGDMLPPGIGTGAALGSSLGYELGAKPLLKMIPQNLQDYLPEPFQYRLGISSEPDFGEGIRRSLITARGATSSWLPFLE